MWRRFSVLLLLNTSCVALMPSHGGGETTFTGERTPDAKDVALPPGYCAEPIARDLTYPTSVAEDDKGRLYVVEAGYSYGESFTTPRLLAIEPSGVREIAAGTDNGPWTGVSFVDGAFYLAEGGEKDGGRILKIEQDGRTTVLADHLPSRGDHHTNRPVVGPDGWVYFGVGTATNAGVVGDDNVRFGWPERSPDFHDVPCQDVTLSGRNFPAEGALAERCGDDGATGAYSSACTRTQPDQVVKGQVPCTGAVLRVKQTGGPLELVAWGFRNPFGLAFAPDDRLYVTDNSYDERGSRPVYGAGDLVWRVEPDRWYGWPDFWGNEPLTADRFREGLGREPGAVLAHAPGTPPKPVAKLGVHASANGLDVSRSEDFGYVGQAFVAQFGDMSGNVGKVVHPVGFRVTRVDLQTGVVEDFAINRRTSGPASREKSGGLERPIDVRFSRDGSTLYIVDFGVLTMGPKGPEPHPGTGVVWRVKRGACGGFHSELASRRGEPLGRVVDVSDPKLAHGQVVYMEHCYQCHLGGEGGVAPAINNKPIPEFLLKTQVRVGIGKMPSFSQEKIGADDLDAVAAYVTALRRTDQPALVH